MKKKLQFLFSLVTLMCFAAGAWAQEKPTAPAPPAFAKLSTNGSTPQYLYNVEANGFYVGANDWGTRASIAADKGYAVKITANGDTYTLETQLPNGNWNSADCSAVDQIWVDGKGRGGDGLWVVTTEGCGCENTFRLSNTNVADGGDLAIVPSKNDTRLYLSTEADAQAIWAVISEEAYNQYVEEYAQYLEELEEYNRATYDPAEDDVLKSILEARAEIVNSTNVYTEEAYEEYYGQWIRKYEDGTLTYDEAKGLEDPRTVTGWHQANEIDDLLLSVWTIGGEQAKDYDKALYINTWSVEGNTDGSEFYTPFFEYWTGDDASLGATAITATLTDVAPGDYTVTAWVRVRAKNGVDAADVTGITLVANDGEAVDVTEGEKVGNTQFNIGEYTAIATVGEDGQLVLTFNVEEDNNISWLSFKNVKVAEKPLLDNGDYLVKNVATGKYLGGANSWGTQASLVESGRIFTVARLENGLYTLDSHTYNNATSHYLGDAGFVDSNETGLTIAQVEKGLAIGVSETAFYGAQAEGTALVYDLEAEDANAAWEFIPVADAVAALEDGTETDATFLLKDASVSRNLYNASFENVWEGDAFTKNGPHENQNAEKWGGNSETFDVHQTITLPNGTYRITANGYYRYNNTPENTTDVAIAAHEDGTEVIYSYLYANDKEVALKSIADEEAAAALENLPFSQNEASAAFDKGLYLNTLTVEVTNGTLTIGLKKIEHIGCDWTVWDNFTITKVEPTTDLTDDMYHEWTSREADATITGSVPDILFTNTIGEETPKGGTVYGNSKVSDLAYADLTAYKEMVLTIESGTPRLTFNKNGDESKIEIKDAKSDYVTVEGNTWTIDLTKITEEEGFAHLNIIKEATWSNTLTVSSIVLKGGPTATALEVTIDVEREIAQGYAAQTESVDFTEALAYLGVENVEDCTLSVVNPDGTQISEYAAYDGWFNGEGAAEYWGANTKVCVKFFQALENGTFEICDMNGADEVGATYSVKWALAANGKTAIYTINVTFVEPAEIELAVSDVVIKAAVEYDVTEGSYVEKEVVLADEDVEAILTELGLASLAEATVYGYNPTTKEFVSAYAGYDGWRDANGDFHNWTGDATAPACVKYTDGKTYLTYNIEGCEAGSIKTYWAIANDTKAVLVEITFTYVEADGISGVDATSTIKNGKVLENNKVVIYRNGVKYGVNGAIIK